MLIALGFSELDDAVYARLVRVATADVATLTADLDETEARVRAAVDHLVEAGLVQWAVSDSSRLTIAPPRAAVDAIVHAREQELAEIRRQAAIIDEDVRAIRAHGDPSHLLSLLDGREAVTQAFVQLQRQTDQMAVFDRPPYASTTNENPVEVERLAAGASYRVVYDHATLQLSSRLADIERTVIAGEEARVTDVPLKMAVGIGAGALLTLSAEVGGGPVSAAVLVRPSVLLDSLVALFDSVWARAVPFEQLGSGRSDRDRLLGLLAGGLKDEAIARHLEVSVRTVRRRVSSLLDEAGVQTRFQLGAAAERLGWW